MMRTYVKTLIVTPDDLDELNHVNNVRYLDWVQEISKEHWNLVAQNQWKDTFIWVVRRHEITYFKAAKCDDIIKASTHIKENNGPISTRIVEFKDNKCDELLVKSSTEWCLLDKNSLRPKRIPVAVDELFR